MSTTTDQTTPPTDDEARYSSLRRSNLIAAVLHAVQAGMVVPLANDFTLPVTRTYIEGPPGTTPSDTVTIIDTPVGLAVAGFFALSALFHVIVASPMFFDRYKAGLARGDNYFRWVE